MLKPVEQIAADYQKECGTRINIEAAGSGTLLSKIRVAPNKADLFLAAEESYIREARAHRLVAEAFPVGRQHVVIAVKAGNPRKIAAAADLLAADVTVALPNRSCGGRKGRKAGPERERRVGRLIERSKQSGAKVSLVGTVTEAAQAIRLGAADAAVIWDVTPGSSDWSSSTCRC